MKPIAAVSLPPYFGSPAPAPPGECCLRNTANGTPSTDATPTGATGGIWAALHQRLADDPDTEYLLIDSAIVRALPDAAGTPKKGGQDAQALGRSRGGFSTKVHITVDGLGNPLRFILTGGQENDIAQAEALLFGYAGEYVIADKGYDAQWLREWIAELGMTPVIPGRSNRRVVIVYDRICTGSVIWWSVLLAKRSVTGGCSPGLRS